MLANLNVAKGKNLGNTECYIETNNTPGDILSLKEGRDRTMQRVWIKEAR